MKTTRVRQLIVVVFFKCYKELEVNLKNKFKIKDLSDFQRNHRKIGSPLLDTF